MATAMMLLATGAIMWVLFSFFIVDARLALDYVRALAWPVVVLGILYWPRFPLLGKLEQLLRLDAFGASPEFSHETQT